VAAAQVADGRPTRTLGASTGETFGFSNLVEAHLSQNLGGRDRLPRVPAADPLRTAVYVTISREHIWVWDQPVMNLTGGVAPAGALKNGPPPHFAALSVPLALAVSAELERARAAADPNAGAEADAHPGPHVLLIVDGTVPYATVLYTAGSLALATADGPPAMALAVRTGAHGESLGQVPFWMTPPAALHLTEAANPLLLRVAIEPNRLTARTRKAWAPQAMVSGTIADLVEQVGELKARDPSRLVLFLTAPPNLAYDRVMAAVSALHGYYPMITLGGVAQIVGPAE
jgi:hypothetical protein